MKLVVRMVLLVSTLLAVTRPGLAQSGTPTMMSGKHLDIDGFEMYTQNEPFQLVQRKTSVFTTPDGTKRNSESVEHVFRDAQARFRLESGVVKDGVFEARTITIVDPVALTEIRFGPRSTTGQLSHLEPRQLPTEDDTRKAAEQAARSLAYDKAHPQDFSEESLGTRVIAGEQAVGSRTKKLAIAVDGSARMSIVTESWVSPELKIALLKIEDNTLIGLRTTEVTELQRGDPDAGLFKAPADLKLEEQVRPMITGSVSGSGNGTSPPQVLSTKEPEFSDDARRNKIGGNVLVYLMVDENGLPTNVRVLRGIGHGLDEKAVEAVKQYKFRPAMKDGQPVKVEMHVQVSFQIFTRP